MDHQIDFPLHVAYEDAYFASLIQLYAVRFYQVEKKLYHYFANWDATVLQKDQDYHIDWLTVELKKWDAYEKRGFLKDYRDEIEYDFLYTCYLGFLKTMHLRYERPSYSQFLLLKQIILERIPNYRRNPYLRENTPKRHELLFQMLELPVSKKEFFEMMELVKKTGI